MNVNSHERLLAPFATVPTCQTCNGDVDWFPPVDILEDNHEYLFKIDLPAVKPEDLRIVVERDGLLISGERAKTERENKKPLRIERPTGYFEHRFALPDDASRVEIHSVFNECVLELHVTKTRPAFHPPTPTNGPIKLKLASSTNPSEADGGLTA